MFKHMITKSILWVSQYSKSMHAELWNRFYNPKRVFQRILSVIKFYDKKLWSSSNLDPHETHAGSWLNKVKPAAVA